MRCIMPPDYAYEDALKGTRVSSPPCHHSSRRPKDIPDNAHLHDSSRPAAHQEDKAPQVQWHALHFSGVQQAEKPYVVKRLAQVPHKHHDAGLGRQRRLGPSRVLLRSHDEFGSCLMGTAHGTSDCMVKCDMHRRCESGRPTDGPCTPPRIPDCATSAGGRRGTPPRIPDCAPSAGERCGTAPRIPELCL